MTNHTLRLHYTFIINACKSKIQIAVIVFAYLVRSHHSVGLKCKEILLQLKDITHNETTKGKYEASQYMRGKNIAGVS